MAKKNVHRKGLCKKTAAVAAALTVAVLSIRHIGDAKAQEVEAASEAQEVVSMVFVPGAPSIPHDREPIKADPLPVSYKAVENGSELFDVPLDESVQKEIKTLCEGAGIEPAVIYAMMWRESRFQSDAVGDNGQSFGLMQIMQKWHVERMDRLGVDDLLDPVQNATVGIDLMSELLEKYDGSLEMALTAYNCGTGGAYKNFFQHGVYANAYAEEIIEKAGELDAAR